MRVWLLHSLRLAQPTRWPPTRPAVCFLAPPQKGGYVLDDWSVQSMVKGLTQALEADGKVFDNETFVTAGWVHGRVGWRAGGSGAGRVAE